MLVLENLVYFYTIYATNKIILLTEPNFCIEKN